MTNWLDRLTGKELLDVQNEKTKEIQEWQEKYDSSQKALKVLHNQNKELAPKAKVLDSIVGNRPDDCLLIGEFATDLGIPPTEAFRLCRELNWIKKTGSQNHPTVMALNNDFIRQPHDKWKSLPNGRRVCSPYLSIKGQSKLRKIVELSQRDAE